MDVQRGKYRVHQQLRANYAQGDAQGAGQAVHLRPIDHGERGHLVAPLFKRTPWAELGDAIALELEHPGFRTRRGDGRQIAGRPGGEARFLGSDLQKVSKTPALARAPFRLAITGTVKSIGGTDSTSGSQVTYGDITFDFGTDADTLDTLVLTGSLDAKRDARILKMPKTDYMATSGIVQTQEVTAGERVTFNTGSSAIYEYIGFAAKKLDLGDASIYTNTAF